MHVAKVHFCAQLALQGSSTVTCRIALAYRRCSHIVSFATSITACLTVSVDSQVLGPFHCLNLCLASELTRSAPFVARLLAIVLALLANLPRAGRRQFALISVTLSLFRPNERLYARSLGVSCLWQFLSSPGCARGRGQHLSGAQASSARC